MPSVRHQGRALTDAFITKHQQHIQKLTTNNVQMMTNQIRSFNETFE